MLALAAIVGRCCSKYFRPKPRVDERTHGQRRQIWDLDESDQTFLQDNPPPALAPHYPHTLPKPRMLDDATDEIEELARARLEALGSIGQCLSGGRKPAALLFELLLEVAYEGRQSGLALALQPLGLENGHDLGICLIHFGVGDHVVVFRPVAQFMTGAAHPPGNHLIGILRTGVQALFEIGGGRRQDKDADDVGASLLAQLLGALQSISNNTSCPEDSASSTGLRGVP